MKLSKFRYTLPDKLIALHPTDNRDESRLMVLNRKTGEIEHKVFKDVLDYFDDKDVMVFNDTRVFPARLRGNKEKTGAEIEVFLLRELNREQRLWDVLVDPARKIRIGNKLYFGEDDMLVAEVIDNTTSRGRTLRFLFDGPYEEFKKTLFDLEMLETMGYCNGIENYSRHLDGRRGGQPPWVLLDYFPDDFIVFIDESHIGVPQIRGMYNGDRSRKQTLVDYGFRLPSALDNRPLTFEEFSARVKQIVYISATPAEYELQQSGGRVVEQVIRPTGLIDPAIEVRPVAGQVDDLLGEIRKQVEKGERTLVTTLTKRMSEDLTEYYRELGVRVEYLHSEVDTLERIRIIRSLRLGEFDVLIGINLLREGLDLPEVSLVAVLDADKEGFLRSERSLIQTCGRAARNVDGRVILYADVMTRSVSATVQETGRRRALQQEYNRAHNITPATIRKSITSILSTVYEKDYVTVPVAAEEHAAYHSVKEAQAEIKKLKRQMLEAARELEFEKAAELRDRLHELEKAMLVMCDAST